MKIQPIISYNYNLNFGINLQSKKLQFKEEDFYVRIKGYGHNSGWAKIIKETANNAVKFIREGLNFEDTLKQITNGVTKANQIPLDADKRTHTGVLRIKREGWRCDSDWESSWGLITRYSKSDKNRYKTYADKLDYVVHNPLKKPYKDIALSRPIHDKEYGKFIDHANANCIDSAFEHINNIYNCLYTKYIANEVKEENLTDVNNMIAEIRWILAHATPWERGSDAISNTFIRSIYKAMGIKAYPLKRGISLDLEAYCTNLEEYKNKFSSYFVKKPEIID